MVHGLEGLVDGSGLEAKSLVLVLVLSLKLKAVTWHLMTVAVHYYSTTVYVFSNGNLLTYWIKRLFSHPKTTESHHLNDVD